MNLIFDKNGYQPLNRTPITKEGNYIFEPNPNVFHWVWASLPERYTLELDLGHIPMFKDTENWWDLAVNYSFEHIYKSMHEDEGDNTPVVTCSPYYLHLCI